jgi:Ca2+-transporting ATPase
MTVQEIYVSPNIKTKSSLFQNNTLQCNGSHNDVSQRVGQWLEMQPKSHWSSMHLIKKLKIELEKNFQESRTSIRPIKKCMTTIHQTEKGYIVITKGGCALLANIVENQKLLLSEFEQKADEMASRAIASLDTL